MPKLVPSRPYRRCHYHLIPFRIQRRYGFLPRLGMISILLYFFNLFWTNQKIIDNQPSIITIDPYPRINRKEPKYMEKDAGHNQHQRQFGMVNNSTKSWNVTDGCDLAENQEMCCLLNEECLQETARQIARVWSPKPWTWWCTNHSSQNNPSTSTTTTASNTMASFRNSSSSSSSSSSGTLWLIKVPKSASSTMAGVVLRIAHRHHCDHVNWEHGSAREQNVASFFGFDQEAHRDDSALHRKSKHNNRNINRDSSRLFLLTPIRHPNTRALSDIYFHRVSLRPKRPASQDDEFHHHRQPSDSYIIKALDGITDNYITEYVRLWSQPRRHHQQQSNTPSAVEIVQSIMQNYDFLFLVEKMTQSFIVLAWITRLPMGDFMVASSKQSGSWYSQRKHCVKLIPPVATSAIQDFFTKSNTSTSTMHDWKRKHALDRLLHAAVDASLEKTIQERIGDANMKQYMQAWQQLQSNLERVCANETHGPCHRVTGQLQLDLAQQSCYIRDFGCGHPCYDRHFESPSPLAQAMKTKIRGISEPP